MRTQRIALCSLVVSFVGFAGLPVAGQAQRGTVTAQIEIGPANKAATAKKADVSNVVVWLTPADAAARTASADAPAQPAPQLVQKNRVFDPHVLAIRVGTVVQFPNKDHFFHNVFSLFDGKRFDLGFYEAGATKGVRFDRVGVSFLFCNIHPEMSAAVVAVDTPYFSKSTESGQVSIPDVAEGTYVLHVWSERSLPEQLKTVEKTVVISQSALNLGTIRLAENPNFGSAHKNKYGQDYVPPKAGDYDLP